MWVAWREQRSFYARSIYVRHDGGVVSRIGIERWSIGTRDGLVAMAVVKVNMTAVVLPLAIHQHSGNGFVLPSRFRDFAKETWSVDCRKDKGINLKGQRRMIQRKTL